MPEHNRYDESDAKKKFLSQTAERVRDKFADIFMGRISGDNLAYAELCLNYGAEKFLDRAEKICYDCVAWDILQRLHRLKIKYALRIDFDEYLSLSETEAHKYLSGRLIRARTLLDETINFCDRHSKNPNYSAENYLEIAALTDNAINAEITFIADEEFAAELNLLYEKIFRLIESAAERVSLATFPREEKIRLLEKIRDFYDANDYTALYRSENFSNPERQYFYQTAIDKLKSEEEGRIIINVSGVSLCDSAFDYEFKGDFDKAIELYEQAYIQGAEPYDYVLPSLARACRKAGYIEQAIETLKLVLKIDLERGQNYTCHACSELINIFFEQGCFEEARKFSEELIRHSTGRDSYTATYQVIGWYNLYRLESESSTKKIFWEKCLEKFRLLDGEKNLSDSLSDFLKTYTEKLPCRPESLPTLEALIKRIEKTNRPIFERAIKISRELNCAEYHIKFLTEYALSLKDEAAAMNYCLEAENFLTENNLRDEYLQSLVYYAQAECMSRADFSYEQTDSIKKKCNYILLTEKKTEYLTDAELFEAWEDAADFYKGFDEYGERLHCLKKALELLDTSDDFEKAWRLKCNIIDCQNSLGDSEAVRRAVLLLYKNLLTADADNLADKIKTLTAYLEKTVAIEEFFALNFFAIYVALIDDADKELISSPTLNEEFFEVFKTTLEKNSATAQVDFVNDVCEEIKSSAQNFPAAEKYLTLIEDFIFKYKFNDIDFKNGN